MKAVFADTSFYVAVLSPRDTHHARAESLARTIHGPVVTTEYVLLEVATFLALLRVLKNDPATTIVPGSEDLWQRGLTLFGERMDKSWSLTALSYVRAR